jgi:hypothetical protein
MRRGYCVLVVCREEGDSLFFRMDSLCGYVFLFSFVICVYQLHQLQLHSMDKLNSQSRNIINASSEANLLRLQVEQPDLWSRMVVGDLVKETMNLLRCASYIRADLQAPSSKFPSCTGRKRKAPSFSVRPQTPPSCRLELSSYVSLDLSTKPFDSESSKSMFGLSLSPFHFSLEDTTPTTFANEERESTKEKRLAAPKTPVKISKGKENKLHIDTTNSEDDFAAQQLVRLQLTPPYFPRRHLHKDPRSLSPTGQPDLLELLAKTCCQEKTNTMTFFSFDNDEAPLLSYPKRSKKYPSPGKFDSLLLAVNNVTRAELKTYVPKSKNTVRRTHCATKKRRRQRVQ